jgi:hypothetical protein
MTKNICPCCKVAAATVVCANCNRVVCEDCRRPWPRVTACYCGFSCAEAAAERRARKAKMQKVEA